MLPGFWQGVFTVGLLATIMSTIDSYAFIAAVTLGRDLIGRWRGYDDAAFAAPGRSGAWPSRRRWPSRWPWSAGSVVTLWKVLGSVGTPVLLLPLALAHTPLVVSGRRVVTAMAAAGACRCSG